jgi:hypothetical protein
MVLSRSFQLLRERLGPLLSKAGAVVAVSALLSALFGRGDGAPPDTGMSLDFEFAPLEGLVGLLDMVLLVPLALATAYVALAGTDDEADDALHEGVRRLPQTIGTVLLSTLLTSLPMVPAFIAFAVSAASLLDGTDPGPRFSAAMPLGILLVLVGLVAAVYIGLGLFVATPLAVLDGTSPFDALKASWERMRGERWRALGTVIVMVLLLGLPAAIIGGVLGGIIGLGSPLLGTWIAETLFGMAWIAGIGSLAVAFRERTQPFVAPEGPGGAVEGEEPPL